MRIQVHVLGFLLALFLGACGRSASDAVQDAASADPGVTHVRIVGELDVGHLGQLKRAFDAAHSAGNDRLVVEIDTPGGELELMWKVSNALRHGADSGVVPIAWINHRAISAGVYVALSCDRIYMSPSGTIGAATPVVAGPAGIAALPTEDGVREKITSAMRAEFRSMAEARRRSPELAEAMIDPELGVFQIREEGETRLVGGREWQDLRLQPKPPELVQTIAGQGELVSLSANQAVELGFADGVAASFDAVLDKISRGGARVAQVERRRSDDLVTWIERFAAVLLVAGLMLAYTEIKTPGFGVPGILAIACFGVLLAGRWLAGLADIPHIVAVALGVVLIAVEIFVLPGTLWAGILGGVLVLGGLISTSLGPGFGFDSAIGRGLIVDATFNAMVAATVGVIGALVLSRFLPKTPILRALVLAPAGPGDAVAFGGAMPESADAHARAARVGAVGVATSALRPVGKVELDDARALEFEARAVGALIERGTRVRVVETSAGRLVVEPVESAPPSAETRG